ncbi:MAG TPA: AMP-binding protein [Acidimicrobiia bacterium]|nr:AMP-binding protein [Acidimicrobiia bacterium]
MTRPQTTVVAALAERLASDPDGPYLDFSSAGESTKFTAREMDRESNRLAHTLRELGVQHGDRVATLLENRAEQVVSFFAALKLGAVQVPINTAYKGEFLRHQLADSGAKVFFVQGDFASRAVEVVGADATPELTHCITVDPPDAVIDARPTISWQDALGAGSDEPVADVAVRPGDLACFIYTAGTTGPSKGCMLSHNYVVSLAEQIARAWQRRADDVVLTPLPLFHFNAISVCVVGTLLTGGRAAIERRFSVSNFWPEIKRTGATMISMLGSPAILIANADDHPDQQGHHLRLCAAAPMPPDTDRLWRTRFGCKTFSAGYGLTEASLISMLDAGEENRPGAAGKPNLHEFDVRLVDDDDVEVAPGEVGEIVCRPNGPNLMFAGYWNRPDSTVEATRNLWFHTGDLGRVDEEGFIYFVDRKKDALRRRGENISSFEMEKVLFGHAAIKDVAVHAVPSPLGEDDVKVTAVLQPDVRVSEEELCRWVADRVPFFAIPRYVEFRADLPRNPVGRVLKYQLRDEGVTEHTWDREAAGVTFERR